VSVSNANAVAVLDRLGYDFDPSDPCGESTAVDFLGRAMTANVGLDDSGLRVVQDGNMIDCGRRAGYFGDRMGQLAVLATEAQARDLLVVWS